MDNATPLLLIILDGFGLADPKAPGNAITPTTAPSIFNYMKSYPSTKLTAHGEAVGLFKDQAGNSEAGHLCIGAGRKVPQDLVRITSAIKDGTFFKNTAFLQAREHVKKHKSRVHLIGMLSNEHSGHARLEHLLALLDLYQKDSKQEIYLHLFTDGRDSSPHASVKFLERLKLHMGENTKIASIAGRFYAMDRNKEWDRTRRAYDLLTRGKGTYSADSVELAITQAYNRDETDEFISPTVLLDGKDPVATIDDNDAVVFFNARSDRARQLTKAFMQKRFQQKNPGSFKRVRRPKNLLFVTMSEFGPDIPDILTAFPSPDISNSIVAAIGTSRPQFYLSETEKYAHVTYFINGGHADPLHKEERMLIQSTNLHDLASHPQMSHVKLTDEVLKILKEHPNAFICVNYPHADMLGHTGNLNAAKVAVRFIDGEMKLLAESVLKMGGEAIITADHGNAEQMIDPDTHERMTAHTTNPVPFILISESHKKAQLYNGSLIDIAPTVLDLLDLGIPTEMTGKSLLH